MSESSTPRSRLDALSDQGTEERRTAMHALHVLEYALAAPAPRRHRTWLHRVNVAAGALHAALQAQLPRPDSPIRLLDEIALSHPECIPRIEALERELRDLTVAVAFVQEQIEPDLTREIDPTEIRERLAMLTKRFRDHQANEADLVYETIGRELDKS